MLVTKNAIVRWTANKTKSHYIDKGYHYTFIGDEFLIPVNDLPSSSNVKVEVVCDYCGTNLYKQFGKYLRSREASPIKKDACKKCHPLKTKEGNLLLYGVDHYTQLPQERLKIGNRRRLNTEFIFMEFKKRGLTLLTKQYKNSSQILEYTCENHNDKGTQKGSWSNIKHQTGCGFCGAEIGAKKLRLSFQIVKERCDELGFILLTCNEEYINSKSVLKVVCIKHPENGEIQTSYDALRYVQGCRDCFKDRNSHANCYNWKGGISSIKDYLRTKIKKWRKDSLNFHENKCLITQKEAEIVHHIYSFEYLLELSLKKTGIPVRDNISKYSKEEKKLLGETVVEVHYEHGYGAALTQEIHLLFHKIYGQHAAPNHFWEFVRLYKVPI
ncbi:hypothetical protein [Fictibacillus phosphorivorans]|uniref:hypothetical protein n=1 Tax=Fictibacillus phosphorivorans TaxID=1221500 RepID=UPI001293EA9C|nr:hypothetical protein [Fictibacillus phosphorivorans]MQR94773.1 hypothetical protein [Fictibacillus phosphorivorans]